MRYYKAYYLWGSPYDWVSDWTYVGRPTASPLPTTITNAQGKQFTEDLAVVEIKQQLEDRLGVDVVPQSFREVNTDRADQAMKVVDPATGILISRQWAAKKRRQQR